MKNIKSLELIKDGFGLEKGAIFTRGNNEESFVCKSETIGDTYAYSTVVTLSEAMITKDMFKSNDWFEKRLTKAEKRMLKKQNSNSDTDKLNKINSFLDEMSEKFKIGYNGAEKIATDNSASGQRVEYADEAMTMYSLLLNFIKDIKSLNE